MLTNSKQEEIAFIKAAAYPHYNRKDRRGRRAQTSAGTSETTEMKMEF